MQRQTVKEGNWKENVGRLNDHNLVSYLFHPRHSFFYSFIAVRRIPLPPTDLHLLPQPSLRKLLKTYPFGVHKPMKRRRHRQSRVHQPKNLVYPEIPTLSVMDINHDLEFLYQNRRIPSSYDMPFGGPPPLWGQAPPFSSRSGLSTPGGLPGLGRPVGLGLGPSNGPLPSANQNLGVVSLPQPSMLQHHPSAYDQYPEASSYGGTRLRDVDQPTPCQFEGPISRIFWSPHPEPPVAFTSVDTRYGWHQRPRIPNSARNGDATWRTPNGTEPPLFRRPTTHIPSIDLAW